MLGVIKDLTLVMPVNIVLYANSSSWDNREQINWLSALFARRFHLPGAYTGWCSVRSAQSFDNELHYRETPEPKAESCATRGISGFGHGSIVHCG